MIPLKDDIEHRSFPYVNTAIIALNVGLFLLELFMGDKLRGIFLQNAFVPADYTIHLSLRGIRIARLLYAPFLSMFLHGGFVHIAGNMLFLWVFGDNVEDRLGHLRYLVFYLLCGLAATFIQFIFAPTSTSPVIGASGAIAGVLGAYLVLFPKARILTLVPIVIIFWAVRLPAFLVLPFWFIVQLFNGWTAIVADFSGGVAWFAHIGGFLAGAAYLWFNRKRFRPIEEHPEHIVVYGDND